MLFELVAVYSPSVVFEEIKMRPRVLNGEIVPLLLMIPSSSQLPLQLSYRLPRVRQHHILLTDGSG